MGKTPEKTIQEQARAQALATLKFLHPPGGVFEICLIGPQALTSPLWTGRAGGKKPTVAGWFKDPEKAAEAAVQVRAEGIYTTLNPCLPALLGRANERLKANVPRTQDKEISHLRNFLIDIDPVRPSGISSSPAEHDAALAMVREIKEDLAAEGWPEPLMADSGNGGHLVYPLEMENDFLGSGENIALLRAALHALATRYAERFRAQGLDLDLTVFNPSRISKLYGTVAAKGENLAERPHRRAQILSLPAERVPVGRGLLQKLVESFPVSDSLPPGGGTRDKPPASEIEGRLDVAAYLAHYGREVAKIKDHGGSVLYCLEECVFDPTHEGNEAAVGQAADGKLFYQCFHNSCKGRSWAEARVIISGNDKLTQFLSSKKASQTRKKKAALAGGPPEKSGPPATEVFTWSDLGNARRLVARHGRDLRYSHLNKEWYCWTGKVWRVDNCGETVRRAKETVGELYKEGLELAWESDARKNLFKFALKSEGAARIQGMLALAQSEPGISVLPEEFDANPWLFNVQNGVIDLQTGALQPHRREDLLTCISPVVYDPKAWCPKFEKFLYQIMDNNQNLVDFLWLSFGYSLTGDTREQCFWIFWGSGANGKGTLIDTITHILGGYHNNTSPETILSQDRPGSQIRSDIARLDGPRLVTAAELDKGRRLSEALIKGLAGQDKLTARFLYGKDFEFIPQFKLFIQTNNKPIIKDQTDGIWRKLKLVEFPMRFKDNPDRGLREKLQAEAPGILAWMVRGCLNWQEYGDLAEPQEVIDAVQEYRDQMNPLKEFLEEKAIIRAELTVSAHDAYQAYSSWADDNLSKKEKLTKKGFGSALGEQGFRPYRTGAGRFWRGLGLRTIE